MNLWIRSQDREDLTKAEHIGVFNEKIYVNGYEENGYCIGTYKTRERALEVLDEIQKFIEEFQSVTAELNEYGEVTNVEHHKKVYEMPKE